MIKTVDECVEGEIESIAFGGDGILRSEKFVIFVPFTAVKDKIVCRLTEVKKSFGKGILTTLIKPGPTRIKPPCPYFGTCGGCQIQHINETGQLDYKQQAVHDALKRIGHLAFPKVEIVKAEQMWAYRRHITLHLRPSKGDFEAGYIGTDHHSLVPINTCPIFNQPNDPIIQVLQDFLSQIHNPSNACGRATLLKSGENQYILAFYFDPTFQIEEKHFKKLLQHHPHITGIMVSNEKEKMLFGNPYTEIELEGLHFKITPQTFIQNHPQQSALIYKEICALVNSKPKKILDLYCGFGMTSLLLAKHGHQVTGIEQNPEAIRFAEASKIANQLHAHFIQGDVKKFLRKIGKEWKPDVILLNPPRTGLVNDVVQILLELEPNEIIYVSCMPSTLARDLSHLCKQKYTIKKCIAYDMFPQTAHVETLVYCNRL